MDAASADGTPILVAGEEAGASVPFAILRLHTARMSTVGVRLDDLARDTDGTSTADLKALCQQAGLSAMARDAASVTHHNFSDALGRLRSGATAHQSHE